MRKFIIPLLSTCLLCIANFPALATGDADIERFRALNIKPAPGKVLVYIYRSGTEMESFKLLFDNQKIPTVYAKSFIVIETDPGRHSIEAKSLGTGGNRMGPGSTEFYTFEANQIYFVENVIGIVPGMSAHNVTGPEFWKRKESHWLKVRDSLSFLDFVGSTSPRETMLAETPPAATQSQTASPPPPVAAIPVIAASSPPAKPAPAAPTPAIASPKPIVAAAPAPPAVSKPVAAPTAATAPAPTPVIAAAPAPVHVPAPPAVKPAAAIAAVPPVAIVTPAPAVPPVAAPAPRKPMQNPTGIAVIIGNRNYSKNNRDLPDVDYALNDAQAMYDYVRTTLGYREGNIIYLKDATQAQLLSVFGIPGDPEGKLFNWVRPKQSDVFVYYSGHGVPGAKDGRSYLLPVDADPTTVQINGYLLETLYANLAAIPAKSVTVVLDACFSGGSAGGAVFQKASSITLRTVDTPALLPHGTIFSATGQNEVASWDQEAKLGLFTRAYLEGLKGAADGQGFGNSDGNVTLAELKGFLEEEVAYAARRNYGRKQTPQIIGKSDLILSTLP